MLQVRLLSNVDPAQRAGIDEGEVSLVNLGASEPLVGVIAEELVAFDPLGLSAIVFWHSLESLDGGLEQGVHVGRSVTGRHCRMMTRVWRKDLEELYGTCQEDWDCNNEVEMKGRWKVEVKVGTRSRLSRVGARRVIKVSANGPCCCLERSTFFHAQEGRHARYQIHSRCWEKLASG